MSQMTERIVNLETNKADKRTVEEMQLRLEEIAAGNTPQRDGAQSVTQEEVAKVVREELAEKEQIEAKKLNIIVQNIPEYDQTEDQPD